jgi:3-phenylpropionate/trans-cinnamate dioxygenase ferredoxin component
MKNIEIHKDDLKNGIKLIHTLENSIAVLELNGKYIAFEDICTHDQEPISMGKIENNCIECPRHQAKFDLFTGEVLCMPATENLKIFKLVEKENSLEIVLEEE